MEIQSSLENHVCYYCKKPITKDMVTNYYETVFLHMPMGEEGHAKCHAIAAVEGLIDRKVEEKKTETMEKITEVSSLWNRIYLTCRHIFRCGRHEE